MYNKYVKHVQAKAPHHRRQHAVQFAGLFTALAFVVWVTTLGVRFGTSVNSGQVANNDQQTQLAGAGAVGDTSQTGIEVVGTTTTTFSNY
ncbi:hypothetical protein A2419_00435 [Candidatus Adlerbacteria bacterium RIFOXYC1_FULL_48_26]|uniref:Uncharacterized protein n=1 Tax=Candidatus Adlerbacteria bacterium RIFOXYC1_FULL_48_26 TaxID=1797247 RepID=A0A1F4Y3G2_9BACT|nr:MAG: hypothetical protein A2419_00435 [Candidatus Adlerbacteria bacterium RIFOXYC1_FULL_48_26]OGC93509.1 MAG: hypothetical protein A2389_03025 [Candidatus Adlerbacteria bacterium RIFOXYB1_FULL_48_10]OGC95400.1 MAG: hypothetical protein A2590_01860 [Candidatus Adlerbacteria bacterium RIFOXYD1_FULL_48_8]